MLTRSLLILALFATACAAPSPATHLVDNDAGVDVEEDKRPGRAFISDTQTATLNAKVHLVMTVANGAALQSTGRRIRLCRTGTCKTMYGRSSATIWVAPGTYTATMIATVGQTQTTRRRTFSTDSRTPAEIFVAMD